MIKYICIKTFTPKNFTFEKGKIFWRAVTDKTLTDKYSDNFQLYDAWYRDKQIDSILED